MIPLSVRSAYSLLEGVDQPETWVTTAKNRKITALALTDRNSLAGIVPFVQAARTCGIQPVVGLTLTREASDPGLVLLVRHADGWRAVCRGLSAWRAGEYQQGMQFIAEAAESLVALAGSAPWLTEALKIPAWRKDKGLLYARLVPESLQRQQLLAAARRNDIPCVAANDAIAIDGKGWNAHKVVRAMSLQTTVHRLQPEALASPHAHLLTSEEVARLYPWEDAVAHTHRIAESCQFIPSLGQPVFPRFPGDAAPEEILTQRAMAGLTWRYRSMIPAEAQQRTRRELDVINTMGYASYFLIVHEIVKEAVHRGIPVLGRGSAANSTVAYALGITHVDPVAHHLFFERFLNPERLDPPDIDLDLPWNRRTEILDFVLQRFGEDHVALIGAFQTFKARGLFREIGLALGIPPDQVKKFTRQLPRGSLEQMESALASDHPVYRSMAVDRPPWRGMMQVAQRLAGLPHHFGIHPCGIAVAGCPIRDRVAVVPSPSGWPATDAAMGPAEDLGLIKIDLLGNRSMGALCDALEVLGQRDPADPEAGLPPEMAMADPETQNLIARGDTVGCFYIESPSMRGVLKRLDCRDFETLVAASSIIRPGVNQGGLMDAFIRRHRGEEEVSYPDPRLQPFLRETHGILVYQEQVIQTAAAVAGMSLGQADLLRRAMGKKRHHEDMRVHEEQFLKGAIAGGMPMEQARALWLQIMSFAGYAFCKAHSASFARLSFQMTWLRAHHPALFFANVLNHQGGYYPPQVYVDQARSHGITLLPPCIVTGRWQTEMVDRHTIRMGLQWVRHLNQETVARIVARRPFHDWRDLLRRVELHHETAAMLVLSGASDFLQPPVTAAIRRQRLWEIEFNHGSHEAHVPTLNLFAEAGAAPPHESYLDDEPVTRRIQRELEAMGLALAEHPLRLYRQRLLAQATPFVSARRIGRLGDGQSAVCVGLPVARKSLLTNKGEPMAFLTLSDRTGLIEIILFPWIIQHIGARLKHEGPWLVDGTMNQGSLIVERVSWLDAQDGEASSG
ncbi:MAG: DNA polymerase III subunit alpha [Magnetococcales bacterium]|nr:DNA polymerase III subunit alpha [Magnetococcales bacterium]